MSMASFIIYMQKTHKLIFNSQLSSELRPICLDCLLYTLTWISNRHLKSHLSKTDLLPSFSVPILVNAVSATHLAKLKCGCHPLPLPLLHASSHTLLINIIALKIKTKIFSMAYKALYILAPSYFFHHIRHHIHP